LWRTINSGSRNLYPRIGAGSPENYRKKKRIKDKKKRRVIKTVHQGSPRGRGSKAERRNKAENGLPYT
jgi:hypothetical protein